MIDKVVSATFTILIVLFLAILLSLTVFTGLAGERAEARHAYESEYGTLLIHSLLISYEKDSSMTYEGLLIKALRDLQTVVNVDGKDIDVEAEFSAALDELLGPNNYYFEVSPLLQGVTISYVLDGSPTMADKRRQLNESLPGLLQALRTDIFGEDASLISHIYILSTEEDKCNEFDLPQDVTCEEIGGEDFYNYLMLRGFSPPAPEPFRSYSEWLFSSHAASTSHLTNSDWASAVAYASMRHQNNPLEKSMTNKHVIVTVADELSTGSKADECFGIDDNSDFLFCLLCKEECPINRSQKVVDQAAEILQKNDDLFMGFFSFPCDYTYDTDLNNYSTSEYNCQFLDDPSITCGISGGGGRGGRTGPGQLAGESDGSALNTYEVETDNLVTGLLTFPGGGGSGGGDDGGDDEAPTPPANANWCEQDACEACLFPENYTPPDFTNLLTGNPIFPGGGGSDGGTGDDSPYIGSSGPFCFHRACDTYIVEDLVQLADASGGTVMDLQNLTMLTDSIYEYFTNLLSSFDFQLGEQDLDRDRYVIEEPITLKNGERIKLTFWIYDRDFAIDEEGR